MNLLRLAPQRVVVSVVMQTIGRDNNYQEFLDMFNGWSQALQELDPAGFSPNLLEPMRERMLENDLTFMCMTEAQVQQLSAPMLILDGNDTYHPASSSSRPSVSRRLHAVTFAARFVCACETNDRDSTCLGSASRLVRRRRIAFRRRVALKSTPRPAPRSPCASSPPPCVFLFSRFAKVGARRRRSRRSRSPRHRLTSPTCATSSSLRLETTNLSHESRRSRRPR